MRFNKYRLILLLVVLTTATIVLAQSKGTIVFTTFDWVNKIDPETGDILSSFPCSSFDAIGLAPDGEGGFRIIEVKENAMLDLGLIELQ